MSEASFDEALNDAGTFLVTAAYEDRYGTLGTIAALLVRPRGTSLAVESWVMSCRAFSRRIEHHCVQYLFDTFGIEEIIAAYRPTERNGPLRGFLTALLDAPPAESVSLTHEAFRERSPALVHRVVEAGQ